MLIIGFGLQTPLVTGHMKTVRYSAYYPMAFKLVCNLLEQGYYSASDQFKQLDTITYQKVLNHYELYYKFRECLRRR